MKLVLLILALVPPALCSRLPFIVGGTPVLDATKWPWQGSIKILSTPICGCALISSTWAVTAAHCVGLDRMYYNIVFGSIERQGGGQTVNPTKIVINENYLDGPGNYPNDIAVIQFPPIKVGTTIKPVTMATADQAGNDDCWITGWGYTSVGGNVPSEVLQEAQIDVYTNAKCRETWGNLINDGQVCVGDFLNNRGSCNGDSGGPLVCKVGSEYQLVGVTSWGVNDCSPTYPSVYTRISYFQDWVNHVTGV